MVYEGLPDMIAPLALGWALSSRAESIETSAKPAPATS
jgi:hypothetical protein